MQRQLTALIEREVDGYVSLCPELDIASQGDTIEEARENLREALELFFETASPEEIRMRLHEEVYVTRVEVAVGKHDGDAYVFKPFSSISSNRFSFSIRSPRFDKRLAAGWLILSLLPISMVLIPSFRCAQKHKSARASTV